MPIKKIHLHQLRHFESLSYEPGAKTNFIIGPNGSGKTSILEAVYILSTGRSFRTSSLTHAIKDQTDSFTVHAELTMQHSPGTLNVGFQRERHHAAPNIKINGKREVKISELAKIFPVKLLCVDNYQLLRNEPQERRQLLDWGVFHVEHSFYPAWQQYQKLLKHRNMLLKTGTAESTLMFWTEQLIEAAEIIHRARTAFMNNWVDLLTDFIARLVPCNGISIEYYPGWIGDSIAEAFAKNLSQDQRVGYSQVGPHRADLIIQVDKVAAKQRLSLGQQKMLVAALHLSQAHLLMQRAQKETVFLLDDLPAELDSAAQSRVGKILEELQAQVFITCVDSQVVRPFGEVLETKMFHVEHLMENMVVVD